MNLTAIYVIVSAAMLLWVGCAWSSKDGLNIILKTAFIGAAFAGAVVVARALAL
jgi:hypothetical protein